MGLSYDEAVAALYQAPFDAFVTERRRLADELKAEGNKAAATQLTKLGRPTISAWAVNQLWWQLRDTFDEMFETAAELRRGKLSASPAHRQVLAKLTSRAQQLLRGGGHSANDATLRRVTMTLSALAAAGGFDADTPGALTKDREPPGFEAFGIAISDADRDLEPADHRKSGPRAPHDVAEKIPKTAAEHGSVATPRLDAAEAKRLRDAARAERKREAEAAAAERRRRAEAEAARQARRKQLESKLREAKAELTEREQERERVQRQLATAERELESARASLAAVQAELEAE